MLVQPDSEWAISPESPLVDLGIDLGLPFVGSAPDIGAYEVGSLLRPGIKLEAVSVVGDADRDGDVGYRDFLILAAHFNMYGRWSSGDFDLNGIVDFTDFVLLASSFDTQAATDAVPEPSGWILMIWGLLFGRAKHVGQ